MCEQQVQSEDGEWVSMLSADSRQHRSRGSRASERTENSSLNGTFWMIFIIPMFDVFKRCGCAVCYCSHNYLGGCRGRRIRNPGAIVGPWVFAIHLFWTLSQAQKGNIKVARSLRFPSCFISLDLWNDLVILLLELTHLEQMSMMTVS